jgi:hypothetical protein
MKEPIIKKENFTKALQKEIKLSYKDKKDNVLDLKLLDYSVVKQIMDSCNSFPERHRFIIWKYLLSLPSNKEAFEYYNSKGIHPFYKSLEVQFPLKDQQLSRKLKQICSLISHWSQYIGNVYYLPNLLFPFVKSIKGDDLFLFELLIAFITTYGQFWFEHYPGAPIHHFKLIEKMIEKENYSLIQYFKAQEESELFNLRFNEVVWRLLKNIFSESLQKDSWLQFMDFIFTYNHKPELLLYFTAAFILSQGSYILKCNSKEELDSLLFNINKNISVSKLINKTHKLYEKYSKYQLFGYKPYIPFPDKDYPNINKFPVDFLDATAKLKEDLFREELEFKEKEKEIDIVDNKIKELLKKEEMMQKCYESLVHKEREKAKIYKQELDMIIYQKNKYYEEMKNKKLEKVDKLQNVINNSLKYYSEINKAEVMSYEEELKRKRVLEEYDFKKRIQQEELNQLEIESTKKVVDLLNLRTKEQSERTIRDEGMAKEFKNKMLEEELAFKKYLNTKEFDSIRKQEELRKEGLSDFTSQRLFSDRSNDLKLDEKDLLTSFKRGDEDKMIGSLRETLRTIEDEEKMLMENQRKLRDKELDFKLSLKKSGKGSENQNLEQLDELRRMYEIKKAELALKKKQVMKNLDKLIEYSIDENIQSTNSNRKMDMFVSGDKRTDYNVDSVPNKLSDFSHSQLSDFTEDYKPTNPGFYDIREVNNNIRNLSNQTKGFSKYPDYNQLRSSINDYNDSISQNGKLYLN